MAKKIYLSEIAARRRRQRILHASVITMLSLATLIVAGLLAIRRLPYFRVDSVAIEGNSYLPLDRIQTVLRARVPADGWFKNMLGARNMLVWPDQEPSSRLKTALIISWPSAERRQLPSAHGNKLTE